MNILLISKDKTSLIISYNSLEFVAKTVRINLHGYKTISLTMSEIDFDIVRLSFIEYVKNINNNKISAGAFIIDCDFKIAHIDAL